MEAERLYWNMLQEAEVVDQGDFGNYYAHIENVFMALLKENLGESAPPELSEAYRSIFWGNMKRITMRTLLFEMELSADCSELAGETPEEQYRYYADNLLKDPNYLMELYREYPLMYRDMLRCLEEAVRNIREVSDRFEEDRETLNRRFFSGNPCSRIKVIDGGDSDPHNGGRTVYVLTLDNGEKLVYKPRGLAVDTAFGSFLQWCCEGIGMDYWWNSIWDRGEYGWCGWVEAVPCHSREELKRYYRRNGILLGICYFLGSRDIHYENVIAHGEYPVIVDLEMGVCTREYQAEGEKYTGVERVYRESVLRTGILPTYAWDALGTGIHVGAINAEGGQTAPFLIPVIVNPGTIRMHVEYRQPSTRPGKNLGTLDGVFIPPWEFHGEIEAGFQEVYLYFMKNQFKTLDKTEIFRKVKIRYLVRQTQEYVMLRTIMYHPDYMTGEGKRECLLAARLTWDEGGEGKCGQWVSRQEAEALRKDDIPYFYYQADGLDLYSENEKRAEAFFQETAMDGIRERLLRMSGKDLDRQKKWIRTALLVGERSRPVLCSEADIPEILTGGDGLKNNLTGVWIADRIGRLLLEEAVWSDDGKDVGWVSILMAGYQERTYLIRPMGLYLYDGLAGVAVFMHRLSISTRKVCYHEMAELLIQKLYAHTREYRGGKQAAGRPTGAFSGEASIAFAYILLYKAHKKSEFLEYLYQQCEAMAVDLAGDREYDVVGGNAGAILVFLEAYKMTGNNQYIRWAREAGEYLLGAAKTSSWGMGWQNSILGIPLTGFAHGASGIMLALVKLGFYTGEGKYHQAAYRAFLFEEYYYDEKVRDWQDLRRTDGEKMQEYKMAWCHGWGGITMARRITEKYAEGALREVIGRTEDFMGEKKAAAFGDTYCLCHGNCGNAALYSGARSGKGQEILDRTIAVLGRAEAVRDCLGIQEWGSFGLMGGITGIGYACLCGAEECGSMLGVEIM